VHPERFVGELDRTLECQPLLVSLNSLLGKFDDQRFSPASYEELIARIQFFEDRGLLGEVGATCADSDVLMGLVAAATYENHLAENKQPHNDRNKGADIQAKAKLVLDCLNADAKGA
jgi:hypothetical protein